MFVAFHKFPICFWEGFVPNDLAVDTRICFGLGIWTIALSSSFWGAPILLPPLPQFLSFFQLKESLNNCVPGSLVCSKWLYGLWGQTDLAWHLAKRLGKWFPFWVSGSLMSFIKWDNASKVFTTVPGTWMCPTQRPHAYTDVHDRPQTAHGLVGKENMKQSISILLINATFKGMMLTPAL